MSSASEISLKVSLGGEVRRLTMDMADLDVAALWKKLADEVFVGKIGEQSKWRLSWKDSDGDDVVVASDADLSLAIKEMKGPLFKFDVSRKAGEGGEAQDAAAAETGAGKELATAAKEAPETEQKEGEAEPTLEEIFSQLSSNGADYLRQLGGMITNALEGLDKLVVTDDDADDEDEEPDKDKKKEEKNKKPEVKDV